MKFTHRSIPFHLAFPCTVDIESEQGILCCVKFIRCPRRFRPTGSNVACVARVFFQCDFHRHFYHGSYNLEKVLT